MRKRSLAREFALQILYENEIRPGPMEEQLEGYWRRESVSRSLRESGPEIREFAERIVRVTLEERQRIDEVIRECAQHWKMERMAVVDRNILRIGVAEILFFDDVPPKVAMNEAIELAKKYGDSESSRFVNGIVDQAGKRYGKV